MTMIDLAQLTDEQKKALQDQLKEEEKAKKEKKVQDRTTYKQLSEEFVLNDIDLIINHHGIQEKLIKKVFSDYEPIKALKAEVYGIEINDQDSHTSTLKDGSASITIGYNVSIGFDGKESAGVEKIKEFISSLADDNDKVKKLSKMVNTFLKPNVKTGMLNPSKIIELSKLRDEFNDERFNEGLDIIFNAQQRRQNSMYISGWKFVQVDGVPKKLEFRFTI